MWRGGDVGERPSSFKRLAYGIVLYIWKLNAGHDQDPKECRQRRPVPVPIRMHHVHLPEENSITQKKICLYDIMSLL